MTLLAALVLAWLGCVSDDPCAGTRDLLASPAGLVLTPGEHALGWARTECFQCHQAARIHANDCTSLVAVDARAMDSAVDVDDTTSCVACHGSNGVREWASLLDTGEAAP